MKLTEVFQYLVLGVWCYYLYKGWNATKTQARELKELDKHLKRHLHTFNDTLDSIKTIAYHQHHLGDIMNANNQNHDKLIKLQHEAINKLIERVNEISDRLLLTSKNN